MKYHFNNKEEAERVLKLYDEFKKIKGNTKDFNFFKPHKIIRVTQIPFGVIIGASPSCFGVLSKDKKSILYEGVMFNYGLDSKGVGFQGEIVKNKTDFVSLKYERKNIRIVRYEVEGE
jgi:hypothetical protein